MIISETRPRARQKRNVINVDNIARVPTVNESLRWDLPCIINLNARSLNTEKIDELQVIASNFNVSIICVTETWLKNYIADESVSINGFYCERRDRVNRRAGGVACYVKNDVLYSRIVELEDQSFEVLWLKIMPKKLPRAFSCIILACIYHPPGPNSAAMRDHVINGVDSVVRKHPNCGVLITGDFNQLNDTFLKTHYRYAQIVKVPTRGQSTLDKIWTNMSPVYDAPITLSELGSSDHNIVLLKPTHGQFLEKGSPVRVTIRCMSSDNRAKFSAMLSVVKWETMFRMRSREEQLTFYQTVIDQLMCRCFPNKVVTRHSADKPWVTDGFRALVRKRQRAHMCGDITQARLFRNKVNRAAVRLRKEFYQAKVTTLSESSTREWWRHMKSLMGYTSNNDVVMQGLANNLCEGNIEALANRLNEFVVSVSNNLPRLTDDLAVIDVQDEIPAEYVISVMMTENALQQIKVNKAVGPDNVPAWVLRDNASTLAAPLTALFNTSLRDGVIPALWKTAHVIPLPKKQPPQSIEKYIRPISLTPIVSKIF